MLHLSSKSLRSIAKSTIYNAQHRSFGHKVSMVLKTDIENVGVSGEVVSVKAGYARNFLYPKSMAVYATESNVEAYGADENDLKFEIKKRLRSATVQFQASGESSAFVTLEDIQRELEAQTGVMLGSDRILLQTNALKKTGTHKVPLYLEEVECEDDSDGFKSALKKQWGYTKNTENDDMTVEPKAIESESTADDASTSGKKVVYTKVITPTCYVKVEIKVKPAAAAAVSEN